jgi:hypothetical protein
MNGRKVFFLALLGLGLVACLSLAVRVIDPPVATVQGHTGPVPSVVSSPESKVDRFSRRMTGHLHHLFRRARSGWQGPGVGEQRQPGD